MNKLTLPLSTLCAFAVFVTPAFAQLGLDTPPRAVLAGENRRTGALGAGGILPSGFELRPSFFPDRRLEDARRITRLQAIRVLGETALSFPLRAGESDPLATATAGFVLADTYVPWPKRYDGHYRYSLVRLRIATSLAVEASGDTAVTSARELRSSTTPDGGIVNLQLSRYISGLVVGGFAAFSRAIVGAAVLQSSSQDTSDLNQGYAGSWFAAFQQMLQLPLLSVTDSGTTDTYGLRFVLGADLYLRSAPSDLRQSLGLAGDENVIVGATVRGYVLMYDNIGVGATWRAISGVRLPATARWALEIILLR